MLHFLVYCTCDIELSEEAMAHQTMRGPGLHTTQKHTRTPHRRVMAMYWRGGRRRGKLLVLRLNGGGGGVE